MKNFLRALRHAWPYRTRLILSVICAVLAAVLWGLNFTSIYPVLKLLHTGKSPQQWVEERIAGMSLEVDALQIEVDKVSEKEKEYDAIPPSKHRDQALRDVASDLVRLEGKLESARRQLWYLKVAQKYINGWVPNDCFQTMCVVIALVFVCVGLKCLFEFFQESLVGSVVNLSLFDLRNRFYRNVIHLDINQIEEQGTSELMARFTNDMDSLSTGIKTLFGKVVAEPLRALSCIVIGCFISWQLTLLFLILVPIAALILVKVGRIMKRATRQLLERMSSIYKILQESFQGIRVVKAFTMEPYERRRFHAATKDYYRRSMQVVKIDALTGPIIEILGVAAVAAALLAGSYLVLQHETKLFGMKLTAYPLEAESLLQLYVLLAAIADPVRKLSSVFTRIQSGGAAADRIFAFLDRQPEVTRNTDGPRLNRRTLARTGPVAAAEPAQHIEFRDVCFSYDPTEPLLRNINLKVLRGETIGIVGPNGCGKSTMLAMLPRFFDPDSGSVLIEGHDLRSVNLRSLRQQVGLVTQKPILFDDTIYNNIAYGVRGAKPEDVEAAARLAGAHDFIVEKPEGYQRQVGEVGGQLSGGQMQRIALARAILRNPSILILDEFTSAIDLESEAAIHRAVKEFKRGRTTFLITHTLQVLELADRILVLDEGRVVAIGTHTELLATCAMYQRLNQAHNQRLVA
jgi:ATP-binding cassette subfamily B protein/subfamily B ATP-binding cassette protein MsbA